MWRSEAPCACTASKIASILAMASLSRGFRVHRQDLPASEEKIGRAAVEIGEFFLDFAKTPAER
jgi:hypothetical protein